MFKNYFRTAWRNLIKNKAYSAINISGLAFGMAVAMLIGLWVYDEVSYDRNFQNYDRICQVIQNVTNNGEVQTWPSVPYPLAEELRKNYGSDFRSVAMGTYANDHLLTIDKKVFKASGSFFEKEMPEIFTLKMLDGSRSALNAPTSIMISASMAKAWFGEGSALNKIITIDELPAVKVGGVYEDFPNNSTFAGLNFIASWDFYYNNTPWVKTMENPWQPNFVTVYVQLKDNADIRTVSAKIKDAKLKKVNAHLAKKKPALFLQPMRNWHLFSKFSNGINVGGDIQYVWLFSAIGIFVLLLACINFMNLSTARSEQRAKEVGIRKTIGSLRTQIIAQFFGESLLTTILSFTLSIAIVKLTLPFFNEVADKKLDILWSNPWFWAACITFVALTGIVSGSYPAFYLSSFKPIKVLKGTFKAGRLAAIPRRVLVVVQFTVSVTLIIGTIIVYRQIQFAKDRPVGYNRAGLISIPINGDAIAKHFAAIREELIGNGSIMSMAESGASTTDVGSSTSGFSWPGKDPNQSTDFGVVAASMDYGRTIGWKMKEGRDFSKDFPSDSSAVVLNEAAIKFMGLTNPVGQQVSWWGKPYTIIGVIDNMIMGSPYEEQHPIIYTMTDDYGVVILRMNPNSSTQNALSKIEPVFKKFNPDIPFEYNFTDALYAKKFFNEERIGKLATFFSILAIAISCLGLFGLASFIAEQRTKEIGVRKVLGASTFNIWRLLSKDFVLLVAISFIIATPVSWYGMHNWLQNYQYRAELSWWIFAAAGMSLLVITIFVVSFQTIKAALRNPVRSLRSE